MPYYINPFKVNIAYTHMHTILQISPKSDAVHCHQPRKKTIPTSLFLFLPPTTSSTINKYKFVSLDL